MNVLDTEKNLRLLQLYTDLLAGNGIDKRKAAARFGVNERSIQRDISVLRSFFTLQSPPAEIQYFPRERRFRLVQTQEPFFSQGEMLAVCKILLESRSMLRSELDPILDKLLENCLQPEDRKVIKRMLANERMYYIPPHHGKPLTMRIWQLGQAIQSRSLIQVTYRVQGEERSHCLKPVGLIFSEHYFYLAAYVDDIDTSTVQVPDDLSPTIYRVDRLETVIVLDEHFVPHKNRFSEGEFRNVYGGKLQTVHILYDGPSVEAVLDRLPTATIVGEQNGTYEIRAKVFRDGFEAWLRCQGECVKVLSH